MAFDPASVVRDFGDIDGEVRACRTGAALFDFSFVARGRISGPAALEVLGRLTRRELASMVPGDIRYAVRTGDDGRLVVDLTIWNTEPGVYEVMSGRHEDISDLMGFAPPGSAQDLSAGTAIFAIQGPRSLAQLACCGDVAAVASLAYYRCATTRLFGVECLVGRLGYTGEAGFEIIVAREHGEAVRRTLASVARPAGFAAADILRIEAGFVLFANEFQLPVDAAEADLQSFAGEERAVARDPVRLVAFRAVAAARPVLWRPAGALARPVGEGALVVTSACRSELAGGVLGLGYARVGDLAGSHPLSDPAGVFESISIVARPFYDSAKSRPRARWEGFDGTAT